MRKDLSDEQVHHNIHVISLTYSLTFQKTYLIEQVAILLDVFSILFNIYREKYPWLSVLPNIKTRNYLGFRSHFQHWNSVFLFFRMATFWSKWQLWSHLSFGFQNNLLIIDLQLVYRTKRLGHSVYVCLHTVYCIKIFLI